MKKGNLLYVLFVFVLVACGSGKDKSSDTSKSIEPNDKIKEANKVKLGDVIKMSIDEKGDVDWYKVEVTEPGYLQVSTNDLPKNLELVVRFAKYSEWGGSKEVYLTDFSETPCAVSVVDTGTYYILVADQWNQNFSEEELSLKIDFIKEFDEFEPNNDPISAQGVEFGKEYKSAIFPKDDEDWFSVKTLEQGYLEVKAKGVDENFELAISLAQIDEYAENPLIFIKEHISLPSGFAVVEPGKYYIAFSEIWHSAESQTLFNWVVNFIPEMDVNEPNDTKENAKEITGNETINLAIFPLGDIDMFKFSPQKKASLKIKGKDFGNIEAAVVIHKLDDNGELEQISSFKIPGEFDIPEAGKDYYITIMDDWTNNSSPELMEIVFTY